MTDDVAGALAANQAFYDAFAAGDMGAMTEIWAHAAPCACAHPGAPLLVGREVVLESWASIVTSQERPSIVCFEPQAHILGAAAYVTCYERIGDGGAVLLATNVFALESGNWRIVHHHASPTPVAPPRSRRSSSDAVLH